MSELSDGRGACPVCGVAEAHDVFTSASSLPVFCNWLHDEPEAARSATAGPVRLVACPGCGHVWNADHDESLLEYGAGYENSLHFSGTFQEFAGSLATRLVEDHRLQGGTALEVGSGKGDFLAMLCERGVARAIGYDPSYAGEQDGRVADDRVTYVAALFPERLDGLDVDLVCTRHVLEHLEHPRQVVQTLRRALDPGRATVIYGEVPDGDYLLRETALWDVIYEHPSHFTRSSLHRLFADADLPVLALDSAFGGQYLWVEASSRAGRSLPAPSASDALELASGFARRAVEAVDTWAARLEAERSRGRRVALWGTGSKGVTFLNMVPGAEDVELVVDVNPRKHGKHVPGTGQRVVGPQDLTAAPPDTVLVMNPLYEREVRQQLAELGVEAEVLAATPISAPVVTG